MKRAARLSALVLLALGASVFADIRPLTGEEAATITKVGWWTRSPAAQAPEDGFDVQRAPDGAVSVAAIEVSALEPLRSATLILTESGGVRQDGAAIAVCITPNAWEAGAAQPWAEAPKAECEEASVDMTRNATAGTWSADVLLLLSDIEDGPVSLMILPEPSDVPLGFDVQFSAPQLQAEAEPASDSGGSDFSFGGSDFDDSSGGGSFDGSSGGFDSSGSSSGSGGSFDPGSFEPGPPPSGATDPAGGDGAAFEPSDTDALSEGDDEASAAIPFPRSSAAAAAAGGGGNRALQALFFVVLATIAAVGAGFTRRFVRERQPDALA